MMFEHDIYEEFFDDFDEEFDNYEDHTPKHRPSGRKRELVYRERFKRKILRENRGWWCSVYYVDTDTDRICYSNHFGSRKGTKTELKTISSRKIRRQKYDLPLNGNNYRRLAKLRGFDPHHDY